MFTSTIAPVVEYASIIWAPSATKSSVSKRDVIQKNARLGRGLVFDDEIAALQRMHIRRNFGSGRGSRQSSVVNRPTTNRRLIDGRPADRPTGSTRSSRQTDQKKSSLLDVDLVGFVWRRQSRRNMTEIPKSARKKNIVCIQNLFNIFFKSLIHQSTLHLCKPNVINLRFYLKAKLLERSRYTSTPHRWMDRASFSLRIRGLYAIHGQWLRLAKTGGKEREV